MNTAILILDDDFLSAGMTKSLLERVGYHNTVVANSPMEFINAIDKNQFDLALVDIDLGNNQTGLEIAAQMALREMCPFIVLSNHDAYIEEAIKAGAANYLLKGASDAQVGLSIQAALQQKTDEYVYLGPNNVRIKKDDIIAISSFGHLKKIHMSNADSITYHTNFRDLLATINLPSLIQVAGGYLVNMNLIAGYTRSTITLSRSILLVGNNGVVQTINIGRSYRDLVSKYLSE